MFRKLRRNKKGSLQDIIFVAVVILFFAIIILISFKIVSTFNDEIQSSGVVDRFDTGNRGRDAVDTLTGYYPGVIDNTFLFLAIGLGIGALILSALVVIHPIFIALFFIAWVFIIFFCGIFSNIYQEMAASAVLASEASQLVFTSTVLEFLPLIVGVLGILMIILLYKTRPIQ